MPRGAQGAPVGAVLAHHALCIADTGPMLAFYREALGLVLLSQTQEAWGDRARIGFPSGAVLELRQPERNGRTPAPYRHGREDLYWKIGITLPDIAEARGRLRARGIAVSEPRQFRDIGFLCHLEDPEGFQIELLQHRFAAHHRPVAPDPAYALGGRPTFGQVTLRVRDIEASLGFYREGLGLKLLSVQPVAPLGFTLYFLAATPEDPPDPDLTAVANREWLWQRPYTTLELQHHWDGRQALRAHRGSLAPGFAALGFICDDLAGCESRLQALGYRVREEQEAGGLRQMRSLLIEDPDGTRLELIPGRAPQGA